MHVIALPSEASLLPILCSPRERRSTRKRFFARQAWFFPSESVFHGEFPVYSSAARRDFPRDFLFFFPKGKFSFFFTDLFVQRECALAIFLLLPR